MTQTLASAEAETAKHKVGEIETIAGVSYDYANGQPTSSKFRHPIGVAVGPGGLIYVTDHFNYCVRTIEEGREVRTVAGVAVAAGNGAGKQATSTKLPEVCGIAVHRETGRVYFTTTVQAFLVQSLLKNELTTIAGYGEGAGNGNDDQATSTLIHPWWYSSVAVDAQGSVYFTDSLNNKVRMIPAGTTDVKTIAGGGPALTEGHTGQATQINLQHPAGIAVDAQGNVYFAEKDGHRIRKLTGTDLQTIAGTGEAGFSGDGGQATSAKLNYPTGLAVDRWNNVYVSDHYNQRVRRITDTKIMTVAGCAIDGAGAFSGDGHAATAAHLNFPMGLAVDDCGNLYIADYHNNRVRKVWRAAEVGLPPKDRADLWPEPVGPIQAVQNQVITLGARVHNLGPAAVDGSKVTVTVTLPEGMIYQAAGVTPKRSFPGYQLAPGQATLDGTFSVSVLPSCPPGRHKVTVHVDYDRDSNPGNNKVDFDVFVTAAKTDTDTIHDRFRRRSQLDAVGRRGACARRVDETEHPAAQHRPAPPAPHPFVIAGQLHLPAPTVHRHRAGPEDARLGLPAQELAFAERRALGRAGASGAAQLYVHGRRPGHRLHREVVVRSP